MLKNRHYFGSHSALSNDRKERNPRSTEERSHTPIPVSLPHCNHSDMNCEKCLTEIYSTGVARRRWRGPESRSELEAPAKTQGSQFVIKKQQMETTLPSIALV